MKVTLIASTVFHGCPSSVEGSPFHKYDFANQFTDENGDFIESSDSDRLAHFAGRSCYQAWDMPREETANDMGYLANIIKQGHFSVLEHASATFYIEDVSRNLTHELIRHRHLSYSELSQRYVTMDESLITVHPTIDSLELFTGAGTLGRVHREALIAYTTLVNALEATGIKGKKAREAARSVIPGGVETKIVVSGNHRAWRDMLQKRYSVHADAEIRELATELLRQLRSIAPATYQDFPDSPFS